MRFHTQDHFHIVHARKPELATFLHEFKSEVSVKANEVFAWMAVQDSISLGAA